MRPIVTIVLTMQIVHFLLLFVKVLHTLVFLGQKRNKRLLPNKHPSPTGAPAVNRIITVTRSFQLLDFVARDKVCFGFRFLNDTPAKNEIHLFYTISEKKKLKTHVSIFNSYSAKASAVSPDS